nr:hypothetical protein [Tanacetum cinerariifolium]
MENLPPPNDNQNALEEEPFMDQAPAAFDGLTPHWLGELFSNINNGWIEWDVPLGGEMDEPMVDPEVNEEVMDGDDWDVKVEWLMAPVTPPRATMTVSSTYKVGGPSTALIEGPSFPFPVPGLPVPPTVIEDLGTGWIHPRVATVGEQVQVVEAQMAQVVSRLEEIKTGVQQIALRKTELQNQHLRTRVAELESHMGIVMPYMLWMEERLTVLEKRLPGLPPGP